MNNLLMVILFILSMFFIAINDNYTQGESGGIENIPEWKTKLHLEETTPIIAYENIPMGYHKVKIAYETFPKIYKNDFNKDYKFVKDEQKLDPSIKILLRVARILTTFN